MSRILIIDDDTLILDIVASVLAHEGHDVACSQTGREGLLLLDGNTFDLVLTDMFMPDVDGIEVLRAVRARDPNVPVVVMSGAADPNEELSYLRMAEKLGAVGSLRKPFRRAELMARIDQSFQRQSA